MGAAAVHRLRLMRWLLWLSATIIGLAWAGWFGHFPFGFPSGV